MVTLKDVHLKVFAEFLKGNFVVKKTAHRFSAIAIGQGHEQKRNTAAKDDRRAAGLTENPAALRYWMVEASTEKRRKLDPRHYEEAKHKQKGFE